MKTHADIKALVAEKLLDAECLFNNGRFDSSYYLAGYVVELYLKTKVCNTLGIEDFFDFENPNKKKKRNDGNLYRPFKVHDLEQLLVLSGIFTDFENDLNNNTNFKTAWSVIRIWNENARYSAGKSPTDAQNLLTSIKIFEQWILRYL